MIKLTKNETAVYNVIQTATAAEDIAVITEMKKAAVMGVLSSLVKKGVAIVDEQDDVKLFTRTDAEVELFQEEVVEETVNEVEETTNEETVNEVEETTNEEPVSEAVEQKEQLDPNLFTKSGKPRKVTNAMKIREQIALVKSSMTKEEAINHVMMFGVNVLGQSKQLAKAYATENYDRVKV